MKKYPIFFLIWMLVLTVIPAQADSIGSPETQGKGKIAVGIDWSYIFNRDLDYEKSSRPAGNENYNPKDFKISRGDNTAVKISYGLFDFLDIYAKLGVANYSLKGDVFAGDTKTVIENLTARNAFLYGGGFKLAYPLNHGWIIGCDAQFVTSNHKLDFRSVNLTTEAVSTAQYADCIMQEWHLAPSIAKKIGRFTPYLGARYSGFRMNQKNPNDPKRWDNLIFSASRNAGVFTGIDWELAKDFKFNIEGRFIDETAISLGAAYRF